MAESQIGLIPQLQSLAQNFIQKEQAMVKAADTVSKAITSTNGLKIPTASSLSKLLGSLPTGVSTIQSVSQTFSQAVSLDKSGSSGGFLNSAIGTAQNLAGAVSTVVGAASALGVNIDAIAGISQAITGVNNFTRIGGGGFFSMVPNFEHAIENATTGFTFPLDLDQDTNMERIQLSIANYQRNQIQQKPSYNPETSIFLPIPKDLREGYSPQWQEFVPGPARGIAQQFLEEAQQNGGNMSIGAMGEKIQEWYNNTGTATTEDKIQQSMSALQVGLYYNVVLGSTIADAVTNNSTQPLVANFTGRAVNPYTTVAFQGVGLRQHQFMWLLAPRSENESKQLLQIFNILRKAALPKDDQGFFLEYPKVVNVKFLPNEKALYNFKRCVINVLEIDHAGSGQPSFFNKTGTPTVYILRLGLKEIEQYTANDVGKSSEETNSNPDFSRILDFNNDEDNIFPAKIPIANINNPESS